MSACREKKEALVDIREFFGSGHGLGVLQDVNGATEVVEVPFAVPGDRVCVTLTKRCRGVWGSVVKETLSLSPDRVPPRCVHFGHCGGCRWQQLPYEAQLRLKEKFVRRCFASYAEENVEQRAIVPCDPPWFYRNKMELTFSSLRRTKERFLGLNAVGGKGRSFTLSECFLCPPWFLEASRAVRRWWEATDLQAYYPPKNNGSLRTLTLREGVRTGDRMVVLTVSGNPDFALNKAQIDGFVKAVQEEVRPQKEGELSVFLRIQQTAKKMATNYYDMHLLGADHLRERLYLTPMQGGSSHCVNFCVGPTAFFQPNTLQAEKLYSLALQMAQLTPESVVYDLYCGTGTLGISAALAVKKVVGIELSPEAALDARTNVQENGLSNVVIHCGDAGRELSRLSKESDFVTPDVVLVDPPRAGLDARAIEYLARLKPEKIVYISCNPSTQADNVSSLIKEGYQLKVLQPVDQFPHTVHIENIALLYRT